MSKNKRGGTHPQKSQVLSDHKKVGNRFIPPWLQFVPIRQIKYVDYILPELLWLGLLNDYYGLAKGAELALSLPRSVTKINDPNDNSPRIWLAPISSYSALTEEQKKQVVKSLQLSSELELLKEALTPLAAFYPECPLNFLFEDESPRYEDHRNSLEQFKVFLSTLFDKYEKAATFMQANAIYIAFATDLLKVMKELSLANFPAVADFPETEESRRVAAGVYSAINGLAGNYLDDKQPSWPNYFWNRGLELESCDFQRIYEAYG